MMDNVMMMMMSNAAKIKRAICFMYCFLQIYSNVGWFIQFKVPLNTCLGC
jgi:hypothetical protein